MKLVREVWAEPDIQIRQFIRKLLPFSLWMKSGDMIWVKVQHRVPHFDWWL